MIGPAAKEKNFHQYTEKPFSFREPEKEPFGYNNLVFSHFHHNYKAVYPYQHSIEIKNF